MMDMNHETCTFWSQYARTTNATFDEMTHTLSLTIFFKEWLLENLESECVERDR